MVIRTSTAKTELMDLVMSVELRYLVENACDLKWTL